jgi:hypothetical protein
VELLLLFNSSYIIDGAIVNQLPFFIAFTQDSRNRFRSFLLPYEFLKKALSKFKDEANKYPQSFFENLPDGAFVSLP